MVHCMASRPCPAQRFVSSRIFRVCSARSRLLVTVQRRQAVCSSAANDNAVMRRTVLEAQMATADNFSPFGQV